MEIKITIFYKSLYLQIILLKVNETLLKFDFLNKTVQGHLEIALIQNYHRFIVCWFASLTQIYIFWILQS